MPRQNVKVALSGRIIRWGALKDNITAKTTQSSQRSEIVKSGKNQVHIFLCFKADNWRSTKAEKNVYSTIRQIYEYLYFILYETGVLKPILYE